MSNRVSPSSPMAAASLVATVSGDPTYSDPPAISVWNYSSPAAIRARPMTP